MKNLGIFYLIFMILITVMPCSDDLEFDFSAQQTISKISHGDDQNSDESCSPICLCTCCGQTIVRPIITTFRVQIPIIQLDKNRSRNFLKIEEIAQNIWQPPKLV